MTGRSLLGAAMVGAALVVVPAAHAAPPQCTSGTFTTPMNTRVLLSTLTCTPIPARYRIDVMGPAHGTVSLDPPYSYTPNPGFHGVEIYSNTLTNVDTNETSAPASVTVIVDSPPTCTDAAKTTQINVPLRIHELPCDDVDDFDFDVVFDDGMHGVVTVEE